MRSSAAQDQAAVSARSALTGLGALALAIGLAEVAILWLQRAATGQLVWVGPRIVWMTPLGYLLLAAPVCVIVALGIRFLPHRSRLSFAVGLGLLAGLGVFSLSRLISLQRLHSGALLVVALGVAVQGARLTLPRATQLARRGPALFTVLLLLVGLGGALVELRRWERARAVRAAGAVSRPNVLLVVFDAVRAVDLQVYGYRIPTTPRLSALAQGGVLFENAFSTAPWTLPSHTSMFTGRFRHEFSSDWIWPPAVRFETVAEALGRAGYRTGGFVANLAYTTEETGLARGFQTWSDYRVTLREVLLSTEFYQWLAGSRHWLIFRAHDPKPGALISAQFLDWQARRPEAPFFAFLNYFDAHAPYQAPDSLKRRFAGSTGNRPRDRYDAAIAHLDDEIGRVIDTLRARGVLQRTIVIVTSDHGEQFGGHGLYEHGNSLYASVLRVPLLILLPEAGTGLRVAQPVSLRNLARTVVELATGDSAFSIPGLSLARFWTSPNPAAEPQDQPVFAELAEPDPDSPVRDRNARREIRALVLGRWHLILKPDGASEAYDYQADPRELHPLSPAQLAADPRLTALRDSLLALDARYPRKRSGVLVRAEPTPPRHRVP